MAQPLSISASIAGLMTIADIVIRNGYKYIAAVRDSNKAVASLIYEVNSLSGTLHSLRNIAEGLEGEDAPFVSTTQVHHIESCYRTLRKISELLDKFELSKTKGLIERATQRLRWPLTNSETKTLVSEVSRHRQTLTLALNADEMSALIVLLARQETMEATLLGIERGLQKNRTRKQAAYLNAYHKKILEWLCPITSVDPNRNQESAVNLTQPGTGIWFTESNEFQEWKIKSNSRLWLHGIPGAGKTILMSTIIQEVEKSIGDNEGFAFFYCDYKDVATQEPSNILGCLIKQLVLQNEAAFEQLASFYESHSQPLGSYRSPNPESLLRTLHEIADLFSLTTILIDGLDEITRNRFDAVYLLRRIQQEPRRIRTLFASRRESDIEECLDEFEQVSIVARSSDLELYVASEIETRTRKKELNIKDPSLKEKIMKRLIHGADGMFRWVTCQIDHLCELPTDRARSKALDQLPRGLPETYECILGRVLERHKEVHDLVSKTLQWLACAHEPLRQPALLEALSITPGVTHLDSESMISEDDLLRWCSSLIRRRATGDGIELAHFTVKEYLLSIDLKKDTKFAPFKICTEKSDKLLGLVCLTYLNLDHLGQYPPPNDIFENIGSDVESEEQSEGCIEYEDISHDEHEDDQDDEKDTGSAKGRHSIDSHKSSHDMRVQKERLGASSMVQNRNLKTETTVRANVAFDSYLVNFPLLRYAALNWFLHLLSYREDAAVVRLSHQLFDIRKSYQFLWFTYTLMHEIQKDERGRGRGRSYPDATTLHWAAQLQLPEVCLWLISQGSDVNRISKMGSPLDCALLGHLTQCRWDEDSWEDEMDDNLPPEGAIDIKLADAASLTILRLIQGGARLDKVTHPDCVLLPLEMALITRTHNSDVIKYLLDANVTVTEHALKLVEGYLDRKSNQESVTSIPSGIASIFSEAARKRLSNAARSIHQQLSAKLADKTCSERANQDVSQEEAPEAGDCTVKLKQQLLQASEYGVCNSVASLIPALQKIGSGDGESTLARGLCLAVLNNHENVVQLLLESEVDPNLVDENGDSPAHIAMLSTTDVNITIKNVQKLVEYGSDLMVRNKRGELVIHLAAKSQHKILLESILQLMGNEGTQESLAALRPSLLQYAVKSGSDANVIFLLQMYRKIVPMDHESEDGTSLMGLAASRKTDLALRLLHQRGLAIDILSGDGSSVLYHAAKSPSEDPFNFLMGINAIDNSARSDGRKAIHEVLTSKVPISKLIALLGAGEDPNVRSADGFTPLGLTLTTFNHDTIEKLQVLLGDERTNVDCQDVQGMTPLMKYSRCLLSIESHNMLFYDKDIMQCINCLMKRKVDPELVDLNQRTVLHHLCWNGVTSSSFDLIKLLISSGASLCAEDRTGLTPFAMLFVTCVHPALTKIMLSGPEHFDPDDILQYIIENAIGDLNKHFNSGIPPLSLALELHSTAAVSLLLSKKEVDVDIRKTTGDLRTALEIAAFSGCTKDAARELLSRTNNSVYGFDPVRGYTILHFAVCDMSDQMVLRELLQSNVNIEALNRAAETPLDTAISKGNLAAVKLLLEAGANTKVAVGDPPMYPLHLAAQEGRLPIVQALVEFGADVNASSENTKSTALHYASKNSAWDLISFLIKNGALLDARDIRGATPFLVAARAKRWHIVRKFTTTLADLSATDFSGLGALHRAILAGSISVVRFLQEHCPAATQDIRDRTGKIDGNFLTSAIESGNVDLFHMFWEDGAQSFVSDYGHGLAHFAMEADVNDVRNLLLLHNIDWKLSTASLTFDAGIPEYPAPKGLLPLHVAAAIENNAAIAFLNDHDFLCDINALTTGAEAYSSLHLAAMFSGPSTVKLLKTLGADLDIKDAMNGQTPLHIAARLGFVDIVTVLLDAGCEPNPVDIHGITPELLAIEHKHHSAAKVLSQHLDSLESTIDATGTANSSASVLKPHPGKPWRLPLARSPHMTKVMTENISIYAIHDSECPETLYNSLEERKDYGVYYLGKPLKRLI